ncbi:MAG: hypothetical protein E3K37_01330 [Candidatus Kuenenia sp.]|nr:hypothetical protein [Candidatus Kuenenia hertensis]
MRKLFCSLLFAGFVGVIPIVGNAFAGEKANILVTTSPNQIIAMGIKGAVTGSSTFTISGIGTVTSVIAGLTAVADDVRYVMGTSSGANVTLKVYGIGAGTATALSTTAANVEYIAIGTP